MKSNNILAAALGIVLALSLASCEKFLDLQPISEESSGKAYTTASQIEAALTGVYESFQSSEFYVWDNVIASDVRSDNHYAGGDNPEVIAFDQLAVTPTNGRINMYWSTLYNAISKANTVLERLDAVTDSKLTDTRRRQIRGEALFLRAQHYFTLAKLFGGVPLVLAPTTSTLPDDVRVPRAELSAVYAAILRDLDEAASLLPDTYGADAGVNKSRATAGAANALAAKACAQMPAPDYARALQYIAKVESSKANYRLIDFAHLFDGNHFNNDESILEIQYTGGPEGNYGPQLLLPPSISGDSWRKFVTPSHSLVNAFDAEADVVRKNATILFENVQWVDEYWGNAVGSSVAFSYKWKNASGWASADRQYVLRYGDIVLLKAEALNETNQLAHAAAEVDKIRTRAQIAPLSAAAKANKESLRLAILNERRLELAQEAQRWDDLVRFGAAVSTMQNLVEIDLRTGQRTTYPMTQAKIWLPIPQQELDRNPALVQNPL